MAEYLTRSSSGKNESTASMSVLLPAALATTRSFSRSSTVHTSLLIEALKKWQNGGGGSGGDNIGG
jgi:hypothetical protein